MFTVAAAACAQDHAALPWLVHRGVCTWPRRRSRGVLVAGKGLSARIFSPGKFDKLEDCLEAFAAEERLEGAVFECSSCGKKTTATKTMRIHRFPECLIIHINRFKRAATTITNGANRWIKFGTNVSFPLTGLKLESLASESSGVVKSDQVYDLYAVINHYGSRDFGHYTAFCKVAGTSSSSEQPWLKFDDDKVTPVRVDATLPVFVHPLGGALNWWQEYAGGVLASRPSAVVVHERSIHRLKPGSVRSVLSTRPRPSGRSDHRAHVLQPVHDISTGAHVCRFRRKRSAHPQGTS